MSTNLPGDSPEPAGESGDQTNPPAAPQPPSYGSVPPQSPGYPAPDQQPSAPEPPQGQPAPGQPPAAPQPPAYDAPQQPAYAAPAYGQAPGPIEPKGLAITALVTGIVGLVFCWAWFIGLLSGAAGVVFGIIALRKGQSKGMSIAGIITGGLGFIVAAILLVIWISVLVALGNEFANYPY